MINDKQNPPPQAVGPPEGLKKRVQKPRSGRTGGDFERSHHGQAHRRSDKVIYETVGKLAGINVLFDPDYTSRRIKIELNGVTLEDALEIMALESKTFWRPVTPNTIFVAADNPAKRKELEQSVIKTFYLSNLSQPTELQDVVNAIRAVLDVQRMQQLPSQNAMVVRGTPDQIALAEKLVDDLDKARPEVIVDIAVMQVSKDQARAPGHQSADQCHRHAADQHQHHDHHYGTTTTDSVDVTQGTGSTGINLNRWGT